MHPVTGRKPIGIRSHPCHPRYPRFNLFLTECEARSTAAAPAR